MDKEAVEETTAELIRKATNLIENLPDKALLNNIKEFFEQDDTVPSKFLNILEEINEILDSYSTHLKTLKEIKRLSENILFTSNMSVVVKDDGSTQTHKSTYLNEQEHAQQRVEEAEQTGNTSRGGYKKRRKSSKRKSSQKKSSKRKSSKRKSSKRKPTKKRIRKTRRHRRR